VWVTREPRFSTESRTIPPEHEAEGHCVNRAGLNIFEKEDEKGTLRILGRGARSDFKLTPTLRRVLVEPSPVREPDMATDTERELFAAKVLAALGHQASRLPASEISGFLAMAGQNYKGALMVVGRAVNGWTDGIIPAALCEAAAASQYAAHVQQKSASGIGECPLRWVTAHWGALRAYNTRRSAFWRSIRSVVQGLGIADVEGTDWTSHLVWSNLYKVSPASGGNPSNVLCDIQFPGCTELLNLELRTYRPSRVLFLTGADWAVPFLSTIELNETAGFRYVERIGLCDRAQYVIAAHPQGKPGNVWVHEVLTAFDH